MSQKGSPTPAGFTKLGTMKAEYNPVKSTPKEVVVHFEIQPSKAISSSKLQT